MSEFTVAAVQASPFFFDRESSTEKACQLIGEAAQKGACLAAFGENWLPGYPWWLWEYSGSEISEARMAYLENSIEIPSKYIDRICQAAGDHKIDVVMGVAEKDTHTKGTVYQTMLFVGSDGNILGRHRKLKPTEAERLVWGEGDGSGLRTYQRTYACIGGLSCMEHGMMLPGYALASQGLQVHIAAWPFAVWRSGNQALLLSRAQAAHSGCYVIAVGAVWKKENVPKEFRHLNKGGIWDFNKDEGGSCIIDPTGTVIEEISSLEESIITKSISLDAVNFSNTWRDIAGHYSRPDVFQVHIDRRPKESIVFVNEDEVPANQQSLFSDKIDEND